MYFQFTCLIWLLIIFKLHYAALGQRYSTVGWYNLSKVQLQYFTWYSNCFTLSCWGNIFLDNVFNIHKKWRVSATKIRLSWQPYCNPLVRSVIFVHPLLFVCFQVVLLNAHYAKGCQIPTIAANCIYSYSQKNCEAFTRPCITNKQAPLRRGYEKRSSCEHWMYINFK